MIHMCCSDILSMSYTMMFRPDALYADQSEHVFAICFAPAEFCSGAGCYLLLHGEADQSIPSMGWEDDDGLGATCRTRELVECFINKDRFTESALGINQSKNQEHISYIVFRLHCMLCKSIILDVALSASDLTFSGPPARVGLPLLSGVQLEICTISRSTRPVQQGELRSTA